MFEIKSMGVIPDTAVKKSVFDGNCFIMPLEMDNLNDDYHKAIVDYVTNINKSDTITDKDEIEMSVVIEFNGAKQTIQRTLFVTFLNAEDKDIDSFDINIRFTNEEWETFKNKAIFAQINTFKLMKNRMAVNI